MRPCSQLQCSRAKRDTGDDVNEDHADSADQKPLVTPERVHPVHGWDRTREVHDQENEH